jgi:protocatechuate 3,4-dioxygenase, beta subunit
VLPVLLCLIFCIVACGQTTDKQTSKTSSISEPPTCDCCVFDEKRKSSGHQLKIASDTATGQRIAISGIVFHSDGKTPAADIEVYFYQTDNSGRYSKHGSEDRSSFAWWHGYTRGFLKTNSKGEYEINTIKPSPYPARIEPAHIHSIVKSPEQKGCYYIADFVFTDDILLTPDYWASVSRLWTSKGIDDNPDYGGITLTKTSADLWVG